MNNNLNTTEANTTKVNHPAPRVINHILSNGMIVTETITTRTITGTRNGKTITLDVEVKTMPGDGGWVHKLGGKPLFGKTGYLQYDGKTIETYRGKILLEDVKGIEDLGRNAREPWRVNQ